MIHKLFQLLRNTLAITSRNLLLFLPALVVSEINSYQPWLQRKWIIWLVNWGEQGHSVLIGHSIPGSTPTSHLELIAVLAGFLTGFLTIWLYVLALWATAKIAMTASAKGSEELLRASFSGSLRLALSYGVLGLFFRILATLVVGLCVYFHSDLPQNRVIAVWFDSISAVLLFFFVAPFALRFLRSEAANSPERKRLAGLFALCAGVIEVLYFQGISHANLPTFTTPSSEQFANLTAVAFGSLPISLMFTAWVLLAFEETRADPSTVDLQPENEFRSDTDGEALKRALGRN